MLTCFDDAKQYCKTMHFLLLQESDTQRLHDALLGKHPNMTVYLKNEIPDELHYRDNRRISPILVVMDEGWNVATNRTKYGKWSRKLLYFQSSNSVFTFHLPFNLFVFFNINISVYQYFLFHIFMT